MVQKARGDLASGMDALGMYEDANVLFQEGVTALKDCHGPENLQVATALQHQASVTAKLKQADTARAMYDEARSIVQRKVGEQHLAYAALMNNYGYFLKTQGEFKEAAAFYEHALEIRNKKLDVDHPDSITTLHNLAELRRSEGDEEGAQLLQRDILTRLGVSREDVEEPVVAQK